nr:unnamed protein product [Spirometra erinaceieuropaei]
MTVSYSRAVATNSQSAFLKLLFRWKGSVYKAIWIEFIVFLIIFMFFSLIYRLAMTGEIKRNFEHFCLYCCKIIEGIPVGLFLGFYVNIIVRHWWQRYLAIPWPDSVVLALSVAGHRKFFDVFLNGHAVHLQLDTVSDINIISERLCQSIGSPMMQQASESAKSACGGLVQLIGQLQCCVSFRGTKITVICYITKSDLSPLCLDWIEQLGLADMQTSVVCGQVRISAVLADQAKDIL